MPSSTPLHLSWCSTSSCSMAPKKYIFISLQSLWKRKYGSHALFSHSRTSYQEFLFHWGWYTAQNVGGCSWGWSSACSNSPVKSRKILLSQTLDMVMSILVRSMKSVSTVELNDQYGAFSLTGINTLICFSWDTVSASVLISPLSPHIKQPDTWFFLVYTSTVLPPVTHVHQGHCLPILNGHTFFY